MNPGLSVAMIVRDESSQLPACLESIAAIADELCLVDTGSSDDTLAVARAWGCVTQELPWSQDFSAARNASLKLCTKQWILVLDADERILEKDHAALKALMKRGSDYCYRFTTRNYTNSVHLSDFHPAKASDPHSLGFAGWFPSTKVRLFPNRPEARFVGKVHELVNGSLEALGITIRNTHVPIYHYPLLKSEAQLHQKRLMYIALGLDKVREAPEDAHGHAELGNQYVELGDYAKAIASYQKALRLVPDNPRWITDLGAVLHMVGQQDQALKLLQLAVQVDASYLDAWRNLGVVQGALDKWKDAQLSFRKARALAPKNVELCRYLGVASLQLGEALEAAAQAAEGLGRQPDHEAMFSLYCDAMAQARQPAQAQEFLEKLGGLSQDRLNKARLFFQKLP